MDEQMIERKLLETLLESEPIPNRLILFDILSNLDADAFLAKSVPADELKTIYKRRKAHLAADHQKYESIERLLIALDAYSERVVLTVTLQGPEISGAIWLTSDAGSVLSTFVN
jgi:hypothetical protein